MIRRYPAFCWDPGTASCANEEALRAIFIAFGELEYILDILLIIILV